MKHMRLLDVATYVTASVLFILMCFVAWEYYFPITIIKPISIKVLNAPVKAGEYLEYEVCIIKYRRYPAQTILTLTNNSPQTIRVEMADSDVGPICKRLWVRIPHATEEDTDYRLHWSAIYHPTPLCEKPYHLDSAEFEIIGDLHGIQGKPGKKGDKGDEGETGPQGPKGRGFWERKK
jgi:hypothetical protein